MQMAKRVTIRQTDHGIIISSGSGIFGTKIRVRHFATALAIKSALKREMDSTLRSQLIDTLIRDEPRDGYPLIPASRLHLVWSR
jgi:hypothetical protein